MAKMSHYCFHRKLHIVTKFSVLLMIITVRGGAGTERTPAPPQPEPRAAAAAMWLRGARPPPGLPEAEPAED